MPWCPKCKNEYVEGVTVCVDCGCDLVESLDDKGAFICDGPLEELELLADFLQKNKFTDVRVEASGREDIYELFVNEAQAKKASDAAGVFYREFKKERLSAVARMDGDADGGAEAKDVNAEAEGISEEALSDFATECPESVDDDGLCDGAEGAGEELPEDMANAVHLGKSMRQAASEGVYEDSAKKAEEFKSGAYTLLFVGFLGLVVLVALISGVLPIRLNPTSQWMTCLVMGALFIIFIVMGVLSLKSSKKLAAKAVKEGSLKEDMKAYCKEKVDGNALDEAAGVLEADPSEMRYFKRTEILKQLLSEQFSEAECDYLDNFVDEMYPEIFGE